MSSNWRRCTRSRRSGSASASLRYAGRRAAQCWRRAFGAPLVCVAATRPSIAALLTSGSGVVS
eukprot:9494295-Pyramimonas_sp.AAC.1